MATPQAEDGHVRIANDLYEALMCVALPGRAKDVFSAILRETWGWGKKQAQVSSRRIEALTGIRDGHVREVLAQLVAANMLIRIASPRGKTTTWAVQKDYERWRVRYRTEHQPAPAQGRPVEQRAPRQGRPQEGAGSALQDGAPPRPQDGAPSKQGLKQESNTSGRRRSARQGALLGVEPVDPKPRGHPAVALWCRLYEELLGTTYAVQPRWAKALKDRWALVPHDRFEEMLRLYLGDTSDRRAAESSYSVQVFDYRFDRLNRRAQGRERKREREREEEPLGQEGGDALGLATELEAECPSKKSAIAY